MEGAQGLQDSWPTAIDSWRGASGEGRRLFSTQEKDLYVLDKLPRVSAFLLRHGSTIEHFSSDLDSVGLQRCEANAALCDCWCGLDVWREGSHKIYSAFD